MSLIEVYENQLAPPSPAERCGAIRHKINEYSLLLNSNLNRAEGVRESLFTTGGTIEAVKVSWIGRIVSFLMKDNGFCQLIRRIFPCVERWARKADRLNDDVLELESSLKSLEVSIVHCKEEIRVLTKRLLLMEKARCGGTQSLEFIIGKELWGSAV